MVRVSAVVIFLNEERFLPEAIDSVRAQTFSDWELILVDDGSTDRSVEIALAAAEADPRIRLVRHPGGENRGMSASRNLGLAEARGEFVTFLDGDDAWPPGKLAEQVAAMDAHPECGMAYGRGKLWRSWKTGRDVDDGYEALGVPPDQVYPPPKLYGLLLRNRAQKPMSGNAMIRRDVIQRVGAFEPSFRAMFEDQVLFVKILLRTPCYVAGRDWLYYRQHGASCTASIHMLKELAELGRFLTWVGGYLKRHHSGEWRLWPALLAARADMRLRQARAIVGRALGRG